MLSCLVELTGQSERRRAVADPTTGGLGGVEVVARLATGVMLEVVIGGSVAGQRLHRDHHVGSPRLRFMGSDPGCRPPPKPPPCRSEACRLVGMVCVGCFIGAACAGGVPA